MFPYIIASPDDGIYSDDASLDDSNRLLIDADTDPETLENLVAALSAYRQTLKTAGEALEPRAYAEEQTKPILASRLMPKPDTGTELEKTPLLDTLFKERSKIDSEIAGLTETRGRLFDEITAPRNPSERERATNLLSALATFGIGYAAGGGGMMGLGLGLQGAGLSGKTFWERIDAEREKENALRALMMKETFEHELALRNKQMDLLRSGIVSAHDLQMKQEEREWREKLAKLEGEQRLSQIIMQAGLEAKASDENYERKRKLLEHEYGLKAKLKDMPGGGKGPDAPLPADLAAQLGLPEGSTYRDAEVAKQLTQQKIQDEKLELSKAELAKNRAEAERRELTAYMRLVDSRLGGLAFTSPAVAPDSANEAALIRSGEEALKIVSNELLKFYATDPGFVERIVGGDAVKLNAIKAQWTEIYRHAYGAGANLTKAEMKIADNMVAQWSSLQDYIFDAILQRTNPADIRKTINEQLRLLESIVKKRLLSLGAVRKNMKYTPEEAREYGFSIDAEGYPTGVLTAKEYAARALPSVAEKLKPQSTTTKEENIDELFKKLEAAGVKVTD